MNPAVLTLIGFICGSIPFSVLLGKLFICEDVRNYGDGNPGATNAFRAGGYKLGIPAMVLDYAKAAGPVALANYGNKITGWWLVIIAISPVLGHAFSPFLKFRGGKAVAATLGIWTGLLVGEGPIVLGIGLGVFNSIISVDGWAVMFSMSGLLIYILIRKVGVFILLVWVFNTFILVWKHRYDLNQKIQLKRF
ncbi:hypothetical protein GF312_11990 [Candidatus Poribacteria bacterium]|nr:hypothetical protein [Candidatus Poribacteria bacterium]